MGSLDILRLGGQGWDGLTLSCCIMPAKLLITIVVQGRVCACACSFLVAMLASIIVILSPFSRNCPCVCFCPRPERTHKVHSRQCVKSS